MAVCQTGFINGFYNLEGFIQNSCLNVRVVFSCSECVWMNSGSRIEGVHGGAPRDDRRMIPVPLDELSRFLFILLPNLRIREEAFADKVAGGNRQKNRNSFPVHQLQLFLIVMKDFICPVAPPACGVRLVIDHVAAEHFEERNRIFRNSELGPFSSPAAFVSVENQIASCHPDFPETELEFLSVENLSGGIFQFDVSGIKVAAVELPEDRVFPFFPEGYRFNSLF